jgi:hypothetical protein
VSVSDVDIPPSIPPPFSLLLSTNPLSPYSASPTPIIPSILYPLYPLYSLCILLFKNDCPKRLVECGLGCGEIMIAEQLQHHENEVREGLYIYIIGYI